MKIYAPHFGAIASSVLIVVGFSYSLRYMESPAGEEKMLYQYYHLAGAGNTMILCNNDLSHLMKDREPDLIQSEDVLAESAFNSSFLY